jgi:uncharacterized protein (TIGR03437 family)
MLAALVTAGFASAQTAFTPGNIVVSRSVYQGTAATIAVGQPLPPVCPPTSSPTCYGTGGAGGPATDSGAYPSTTSTNNVFNNDLLDGSFGVISPIFLDQLTPTGTLVNTLAIPTTMVNTSFSSKSELALNLSADGTVFTFMGYIAPVNTVDVSDANSPAVYDPTNPAGGSYFRSVVQVGANGAIQVTPTNSFSGNNGRAAALANGYYYMVGNANNGGGTPADVIATAGAQMAIPGQAYGSPAIQIGDFSISQVINPATGLPYPADKAGKDNNFRGLTIYKNTMYVTKGSGSNGFNTVYQVGDKGSLPTPANAASAALSILPGFPNTLAKNATQFPFGLFFANDTTLYVSDEGPATGTTTTAGLGKWVLTNGTWKLLYTLQAGLNLGQPYTVANYPTAVNPATKLSMSPATSGLRNITGKINGDGTVTIFALTSTQSGNGDPGADPNLLVAITDTIAATTPGANEAFTTLKAAQAGEVLRGVCLTPTASGITPAMANVPLVLSAATPSATALAPGSLATVNSQSLTTVTATATPPFQTTFMGTSVSIVDSFGTTTAAPILSVSPDQVLFLIPSTVAVGTAQVTVTTGTSSQTANNIQISSLAPALLTLSGNGVAAAYAVTVAGGGASTVQQVYTTNSDGAIIANPISLATGSTYLVMFGTGIAAAGTGITSVTINGVNATVTYAGKQGADTGLDQVNILIPNSLAGKGNVLVQLSVGTASNNPGFPANPVMITIK